jgi:hypothetical protein
MDPEKGVLGALVMAVGGAVLFEFLYILTTPYIQNVYPSPDAFAALFGFISFLFLGLGLLLVVQSGIREQSSNAR